jgi:hypothetical protein
VRLTLGAGTKQGELARLGANDFLRLIEANRRNARKSTGPATEEGKQRSRCNAIYHGLTAETVIGALEDAEDYKAFEAAVIADYDAQSAVERELVLRLATLLWRLRRATTMETGLLEIQAEHLSGFKQAIHPASREVVYALFGRADSVSFDRDPELHRIANGTEVVPSSVSESVGSAVDLTAELARCFLRLATRSPQPV